METVLASTARQARETPGKTEHAWTVRAARQVSRRRVGEKSEVAGVSRRRLSGAVRGFGLCIPANKSDSNPGQRVLCAV